MSQTAQHLAQPPPVPVYDFQTNLPPIDLEKLANAAVNEGVAKAMFTVGTIFAIGLSLRFLGEAWAFFHSDRPTQCIRQLGVVIFLMLAVYNYQSLTMGGIRIVTSLGNTYTRSSSSGVDINFMKRKRAYEEYRVRHAASTGRFWYFTVDSAVVGFMEGILGVCYIALSAVIYALRCIQIYALALLIYFGPIILGLSSLGEFFKPLAVAWFWGMVEICMWSPSMAVLLRVFASFGENIPQSFTAGNEIANCLVLLFLCAMVPTLSAFLVRGSSAAYLSAGPMMALGMAAQHSQTLVRSTIEQYRKSSSGGASGAQSSSPGGGGSDASALGGSGSQWMQDKIADRTTSSAMSQATRTPQAPDALASAAIDHYTHGATASVPAASVATARTPREGSTS